MIEISPKEYEKELNWDDGMLYCAFLVIDGKTDWRMPNIAELKNISTIQHDFYGRYWSSFDAGCDDNHNNGWDFTLAWADYWDKKRLMHVRPVRTVE